MKLFVNWPGPWNCAGGVPPLAGDCGKLLPDGGITSKGGGGMPPTQLLAALSCPGGMLEGIGMKPPGPIMNGGAPGGGCCMYVAIAIGIPGGGAIPGCTMPGGAIPGGTMPGGAITGGAIPCCGGCCC